jgi:hypothetical protein
VTPAESTRLAETWCYCRTPPPTARPSPIADRALRQDDDSLSLDVEVMLAELEDEAKKWGARVWLCDSTLTRAERSRTSSRRWNARTAVVTSSMHSNTRSDRGRRSWQQALTPWATSVNDAADATMRGVVSSA